MQAGELPGKLNLVVQPIMATLRRETNPLLRSMAAVALAELVGLCAPRTPSPNGKCVPADLPQIEVITWKPYSA